MMGHILSIFGGSVLIGNVSHLFINVQEGDRVLAQPWTSHLVAWGPGPAVNRRSRGRREGEVFPQARTGAAPPPCPLACLLHATVSQQTLSACCMLGTACRSSECSSCSLDWGRAHPQATRTRTPPGQSPAYPPKSHLGPSAQAAP